MKSATLMRAPNEEGEADECSFARLVPVQVITDATGSLGVLEASRQIGFVVRRVYFLTNVSAGASRGAHGHKALRQCFVCVGGAITIEIVKGGERRSFRLDHFSQAIQVDAGCWRDITDATSDATLMVLASVEYDESDYIRNYDDFLAWEAAEADRVRYAELGRYVPLMQGRLESAVLDVVSSGNYVGGGAVERFERGFAAYCNASGAVGLGNGLDALYLALRAKGIGPGDEVVIPAHTFVATALAVDRVGAVPVLVDVESDTGLIDARLLPAAITSRTKAIIVVHLYGHPVDMDQIRAAAGDRDIFILEDAAQAHGALYKGRPCGSLGGAAAFSFYPTKNLGALGDGGGLVSDDEALIASVRQLANYGSSVKYHHDEIGVNSRLDPIHAAVLSEKLTLLDGWNARRRALADRYIFALSGINGLELPAVRSWAIPVWHVFPVRVPGRRNELIAFLNARQIGTNIHYPVPVHRQGCYAGRWNDEFPVADELAASLLSLPLDPTHLDREIDAVISAVKSFFVSP